MSPGLKIPFLDGVRGLLALWVFWGHLAVVCRLWVPGLSAPGAAVDAFMMLSGFLMVHTTRHGSLGQSVSWAGAWRFYGVRWFRIAPLYYTALVVCLLAGPSLSQWMAVWMDAVEPAQAVGHLAFLDDGIRDLKGLAFHMTFLFGLLPSWAASTPITDWSLSLEMQFYAIFPLLCLACFRQLKYLVPLVVVALVLGWAMPVWFGQYRVPGLYAHFPQPSPLPYKLHVFLAGMLLSKVHHGWHTGQVRHWPQLALALLCVLPCRPMVWAFFVCFVVMLHRPDAWLARSLSGRYLRKLGDWSYAIYLIHFLVIAPVLWGLQSFYAVAHEPAWVRYLLALACCSLIVFSLSEVLHRCVELPALQAGKKLLGKSS